MTVEEQTMLLEAFIINWSKLKQINTNLFELIDKVMMFQTENINEFTEYKLVEFQSLKKLKYVKQIK